MIPAVTVLPLDVTNSYTLCVKTVIESRSLNSVTIWRLCSVCCLEVYVCVFIASLIKAAVVVLLLVFGLNV